jgi:hypothetical protein
VPAAIQLDNQVLRHAGKIGDVTSDRNSWTTSETLKLLAPQQNDQSFRSASVISARNRRAVLLAIPPP